MFGLLALGLLGCVTDIELRNALDRDGDGYLPVVAGGPDCDEGRADVNPGQVEICGDGIDNDCDGFIDDSGTGNRTFYVDGDNDGFGAVETVEACVLPPGFAEVDGDCDDGSSAFHPAAEDFCDGVDQDCDGVVDDDAVFRALFEDADDDGAGNPEVTVEACSGVDGYVADAGDCDDTDANVRPGVEDLCNEIDDDCDGVVDDDAEFAFAYIDDDGDGIGDPSTGVITCAFTGRVLVAGDCDDSNANIRPGIADGCDGVDTDCDGAPDDDAEFVLTFADGDGDGSGDPATADVRCDLAGRVANGDDCDDTDASFAPNQTDACDGLDQDCDGIVDDDAPTDIWFPDVDGDGFGDPDSAVTVCGGAPAGYIALGGDCDDADASRQIPTWYPDTDGDGYGAGEGVPGCEAPAGHVEDDTDCDDGTAARNPGLTEVCENGIDDDCSDETDCRFAGEINMVAQSFFDVSPHWQQDQYRLGNVVGGPGEDIGIGDYLIPGRSALGTGHDDFFSTAIELPGHIPSHGYDFDGDGYNEVVARQGSTATVYHGGDLSPMYSFELDSGRPLLFNVGTRAGVFFATGQGDLTVAEWGGGSRVVARGCGTRVAIADDHLLSYDLWGGSNRQLRWIEVEALLGSSVESNCGDWTSVDLTDEAFVRVDPDTGHFGLLDYISNIDRRYRGWHSFSDFREGLSPLLDETGGAASASVAPAGDLDGDGELDFIGGGSESFILPTRVVLHYGAAGPFSQPASSFHMQAGGAYLGFEYSSGLHDLDLDGYDDLVFVGDGIQWGNVSVMFSSGI